MIRKIRIRNFKSIKETELDIPSFAVLVGNNASGKTNFLKAIALISLLARGDKIDEALSELGLATNDLLFDKNNPKIEFEVDLLITGRTVSYSFTIEQKVGEAAYKVLHETLVNRERDKMILERTDEKIVLGTEQGDQLKETQTRSDQLALSVFKDPALISAVQSVLSSIVLIKAGVEGLRRAGLSSNLDLNLTTNLSESLFKLKSSNPQDYDKLIQEFSSMAPEIKNLDVRQVGDRIALYL